MFTNESLDANVPVSPRCCIFVGFVLSFLIVPAPAITFTALLASDNLPPGPAEPLSDTHAAIFAYAFHLEFLILAIRQTGRKRNYGAGSCLVAARRCVRACTCEACVRVISPMFHLHVCGAEIPSEEQTKGKKMGSLCKLTSNNKHRYELMNLGAQCGLGCEHLLKGPPTSPRPRHQEQIQVTFE